MRSQKDVKSVLLMQKQHHLMKLTPWEQQQEFEINSNGDNRSVNRQDADIHAYERPGIKERALYENTGKQQLQHSSTSPTASPDSANTAWVRYYGSGLAQGDDVPKAIAVDSSGNVFVTGSSTISPYSTEFYTIKYNSAGNEVWHAKYNNGEGTENTPYSICVDHLGNIYVTGSSDGADSSNDIVTIKYDSNGDTLWVRRYNGTGNSDDYPCTIEVDRSGYVYIAGTSSGLNTEYDLVTIKYDSLGNSVWTCRYDGPANQDDVATELKFDDSGNVYVAGSSVGLTAYHDYVVIKYTGAGDTDWVRRYDGPGMDEDFATALAVDDSNNVFVNGYSTGGHYDYATIKYNTNGEMMWLRRFNGSRLADDWAYALVIDNLGYIYVSGYSYSPTLSAYIIIKYKENGDTVWTRQNAGQDIGNDRKSLIVDKSGSIYLRGDSYDNSSLSRTGRIIKYTNNGDLLWVGQSGPENPVAFVIDESGNAYLTGSTGGAYRRDTYATYKYNPDGDSVWYRHFDGTGNSHDASSGAVIDGLGNIYITGISDLSDLQSGYVTIKYNVYGDTLWVRLYNGNGRGDVYGSAIGRDSSGNLYVTSFAYRNYVTLKYNPDGDQIWAHPYNGPGNAPFNANAQVVDKDGNVYVTGFSELTSLKNCFTTIKYESGGDTVWVRSFIGNGDSSYIARAIAIDDSGNVYVTGSMASILSTEYATVKYNSIGDTVWVRYYSGPDNDLNEATAICVDDSGGVYVTGTSSGLDHNYDYATIKYNRNGDTLWVSRYKSPANWNNFAKAIVPDRLGNVYVSGTSSDSYLNGKYLTIKYKSNGDTAWTRLYRRQSLSFDKAKAIDVDLMGNVYVCGKSYGEDGVTVSATIKYSSDGDLMWTYLNHGRENTSIAPSSLIVDDSNNVIITGTNFGRHGSEFAIIKYIQSPDGVFEQPSGVPGSFTLRQNYPNPFNPTTKFSFVIGHSSLVTIKVYDILGKEVATVLNNRKYEIGSYEIPFDASRLASGIYFYRLEAVTVGNPNNSFTQVKKMVLIK